MTALSALAAIVILAIAVTAAVRRRAVAAATPAADKDRADAIRTARRELKAAKREHEAVLREVQRELGRAQAPRELGRLQDARCDRARIDATAARLAHLEATAPAAVARLMRTATDEQPAALRAT